MDLSLVIPTYNEKENISNLIDQIEKEFKENQIKGEIIVVDDNSPDGTGDLVESIKSKIKNIKVIHRAGKLGLSSAVLEGWNISEGKILGVMDADLSHPTESIKDLFYSIKNNEADFTIGSRYIPGGRIEGWTLKRKIMSKTATLLSRPYTKVKDPMSGFFMIKKECIKDVDLNPKGFKILLEVLIKGKYKKVKEIPITFKDRIKGKSKASTKEIIYYLQNLRGYGKYKTNSFHQFIKFAIVGGIGTLINLLILFLLTDRAGLYYMVSAIIAFLVAMTSNYLLNKVWTFNENIKDKAGKKYLQFTIVSVFALVVNLLFLYVFTDILNIYYLVSQLLAIAISMIINFIGNKIWTFKR